MDKLINDFGFGLFIWASLIFIGLVLSKITTKWFSKVIEKMGFTNARFIQDHWHLYDSGLKKTFGSAGYELLKSHLVRMVQSPSAGDFDEIYVAGKNLLHNQPEVNGDLICIFDKFASSRIHYAEFCMKWL